MSVEAAVLGFLGVLRRAGLAVGSGEAIDAVRALAVVGIGRRDDVFSALRAVCVRRREDQVVFAEAFRRYWRAPGEDGRVVPLPGLRLPTSPPPPAARRVSEALAPVPSPAGPGVKETAAALSWSDRERLQRRDFAQMSAAELAEAAALLRRVPPPFAAEPTRRYRADRRGRRADLRATLAASARRGFDWLDLRYHRRRTAPPPLVVLCDISGSMDPYARLFLRYLHALMGCRPRVQVFLFGTRLTPVSRELRQRDGDAALAAIGAAAPDWSGGTRIGECLATFNRDWARRVLVGGAVVLLLTDGLDRDGGAGLAREMERLRLSCRRLVWVNPLLRFAGFAARYAGARAMIAHVDEMVPAYNVQTLMELGAVIARASAPRPLRTGRWS